MTMKAKLEQHKQSEQKNAEAIAKMAPALTAKQEKTLGAAREILTAGGRELKSEHVSRATAGDADIYVKLTTEQPGCADYIDTFLSRRVHAFFIGPNGGCYKYEIGKYIYRRYFKPQDIETAKVI